MHYFKNNHSIVLSQRALLALNYQQSNYNIDPSELLMNDHRQQTSAIKKL